MTLRLGALLFAFLSTALFAAIPPHRLKVTVQGDVISIEHATAGGTVFLVGYEKSSRDFSRVYRRVEKSGVATIDRDIRFAIGRPIAPNSLWLAVDVGSGAYGAVTADGRKLREAELLPDKLKKDERGAYSKAVLNFPYVYVVVVRPGAAAWELTAGDGGSFDGDGLLDGKIEVEASRLLRKGTGDAVFGEYRRDDLVIAFVPRQMGYVVAEVKK